MKKFHLLHLHWTISMFSLLNTYLTTSCNQCFTFYPMCNRVNASWTFGILI
jgi:hypothetical protein